MKGNRQRRQERRGGQSSARKDDESPYRVVYSTDPPKNPKCPGCYRPPGECRCKDHLIQEEINPRVRIERKGRAGKSVTVLYQLPPHEKFLKELSATIKRSLGGGGTHYVSQGTGVIEIQGERTEEVLALAATFFTAWREKSKPA